GRHCPSHRPDQSLDLPDPVAPIYACGFVRAIRADDFNADLRSLPQRSVLPAAYAHSSAAFYG
ncbi:MAG: hypothetical protein ACRELG_10865, partial [Gemmataceae bacterium]